MPRHLEDAEQAALFEWAAYKPTLRWLHAIPNGGNREPREALRLKRQGVKPGVSDIFLPVPSNGYHGLYIELKRRKLHGRASVTRQQSEFLTFANSNGYRAVICYGANEAIEEIERYLDSTRLPPPG